MLLLVIAVLALIATLSGGLFALRFKDNLHAILSFSAGAVIGVAFFDLLPEALHLGTEKYAISTVTAVIAFGFAAFMLLSRWMQLAASNDEQCENPNHTGKLAATSLIIHSVLDGVAIGLAFQISQSVGVIVAVAVIAHDFSDGINTASLILRAKGDRKEILRWLTLDALAPVLGIASTFFFKLSGPYLGLVLSLFCGFFIYIGASDLLPESHHQHPGVWNGIMTLAGMVLIYVAIQLVS